MGFQDQFQDEVVLVKVLDTLAGAMKYVYWVRGKINDEGENYIVIKNATIGTNTYYLYEADELVINKRFILKINTYKERDVENAVLRRYRKNRIGWFVGFVFIDLGLLVGILLHQFLL